jgi:hypothetical protein
VEPRGHCCTSRCFRQCGGGAMSERVARMVGLLTCVPSKVSLVLEVLGTDEASLKDDIDYQHDRSR